VFVKNTSYLGVGKIEFDDFIEVAKYLLEEKRNSPDENFDVSLKVPKSSHSHYFYSVDLFFCLKKEKDGKNMID